MQFANDITPLTLASTADLRARIATCKASNPTILRGLHAELESRDPNTPANRIGALEEELNEKQGELSDEIDAREDAEESLEEAKKLIAEIRANPDDAREILDENQ